MKRSAVDQAVPCRIDTMWCDACAEYTPRIMVLSDITDEWCGRVQTWSARKCRCGTPPKDLR